MQTELQQRNNDGDLRMHYAEKDCKRSELILSDKFRVKPVEEYEAESQYMFLTNKELQECITLNGTFFEIGSAPGGQAKALQKNGMKGVGISKPPCDGGLFLKISETRAFEHYNMDFCDANAVTEAEVLKAKSRVLRKNNGRVNFGLASAVLFPNSKVNTFKKAPIDFNTIFDSDETFMPIVTGLDNDWNIQIKNSMIKNGLGKEWNRINKSLPYIPLYRNEILFFCKTLIHGGNLLLIIGETGVELLFGILEKLNPLFEEKPLPIFPSEKFRASPQFYILWRGVRLWFFYRAQLFKNKLIIVRVIVLQLPLQKYTYTIIF